MKARLHKIEIQNFKAFRKFALNLEGRHLLVYGDNGAGKSSLYWALYTFLQSARKPINSIAKYFDPAGQEKLLNIHEQASAAPKPGEIVLTLRDVTTKKDTIYRISQFDHDTHENPIIAKGDLASDFITYRFFFGFSHFRNSDSFDLWPLFEREILPFCVTRGGRPGELENRWNLLKASPPNPNKYRGTAGAKAFRVFNRKLKNYSDLLKPVVDEISSAAQVFYDANFSQGDSVKIELKLAITRDAYYSKEYDVKMSPVLRFGILANGVEVKPQSFMNEAKMTQLALSVRFAASIVNLHDSDLKLLVLDDLLVSLDMSNRMKVVEILLTDPALANYQKIILTHDLGFFREFGRNIGPSHPEWSFIRLVGNPATEIKPVAEKNELQKAEDYLHGHCLDEAALCLRKACEDTAKRFIAHNEVLPTNKFMGLAEALREARNKVTEALPKGLYGRVFRDIPPSHACFIVPSTESDIDERDDLSLPEKGKLKKARKRLREVITPEHAERFRQIKLIDDVIACTERVLNPAAHSGSPPLYEKEVEDALALVRQLESTLQPGTTP